MKKQIKKLLNSFGYNITKKNNNQIRLSFDDIYKLKINNNPVIFDIGANQGQSIERFKKIFPQAIVHAFEPIEFEFEKLNKKYKDDQNVILNNFAVGDKEEIKDLYITAKTENTSFNKLRKNSQWLKERSKQFKTSENEYTKKVQKTQVITLDSYCHKNSVQFIDILKIDTQGYEDKVLKGCEDIFKNNLVKAVETEIMFDDVYEKHLTFTDIEKNLLPYNFRFSAIENYNYNLFEGIVFFANLLYLNEKKISLENRLDEI